METIGQRFERLDLAGHGRALVELAHRLGAFALRQTVGREPERCPSIFYGDHRRANLFQGHGWLAEPGRNYRKSSLSSKSLFLPVQAAGWRHG
jgi:hypothetical protein